MKFPYQGRCCTLVAENRGKVTALMISNTKLTPKKGFNLLPGDSSLWP